jgi:multidrug efflux pump subunit AcrB
MNSIFTFFAKRHILAGLITVTILLLGLNSFRTLRRDQYPDMDMGRLLFTTTYPGAAPEDVELNVTNKIEDSLKLVTGIDRVVSTSTENVSWVDVFIDPDVKDMGKVKQNIRDAVGRITDFPAEVTESPEIDDITTALIPIIEVGLTADLPYGELREIARRFEKKLKEVPGVSYLYPYGYRAREVKVEVNPAALSNYQIPLRDIIMAIETRNIRQTGGTFESYTSEKNVVTLAQFKEPVEVGDVIIRSTFEGPQIRVKDLAIVSEDFEDAFTKTRIKGMEAISFLVFKKETADIIKTTDAVKKLIQEESAKGLFAAIGEPAVEPVATLSFFSRLKNLVTGEQPELAVSSSGPVRIVLANDASIYVRNRFQIVAVNAGIGLILVLIVLTVFLNLRTAFWVALGIPVATLGVFFLMPIFNIFLDSISLTSLILVMGIIVDDGIIISENISRHREMGKPPLEAAVHGVREVFFPVLTTVLTTFLAFAPMLFIKGVMGKFVSVIPLTVSLALFISLSEAVFALPAHLVKGMEKSQRRAVRRRRVVRDSSTQGVQRKAMRKWFEGLRQAYRRFCHGFLKYRYLLVVLFIALFAVAVLYAVKSMDFILFPSKGADRFQINVELPMGSSLEATALKLKEIEDVVQQLPEQELEAFLTRIGTAGWPPYGQAENYAMVMVALTPYSDRVRSADEIVEELRGKTDRLQGLAKIVYAVDTGGLPVGKPINLRVSGTDDKVRKQLVDELVSYLESIDGVKDIDRDDIRGKDQLEIKIKYSRLARFGLTAADVAQNVRIAFDGQVVTSLRDGDEDIDFRVKLTQTALKNEQFLLNLPIPNRQGRLIRLAEVASLVSGPGPNSYRHYDGERTTTVVADVDKEIVTPLTVTEAALENLDVEHNWPGMSIAVGGEAEETEEAVVSLAVTFIIAFIGIYFLLVLLFNSFSQPFLVMIAIPFGFVGVIIALVLHGEPLGFMAITGLIGLAGVVVNDSLVLVSHLNVLRRQKPEANIRELAAEGTADRLRAILLTTFTTVAALIPLAYGIGGYDLYMAPMALTLGWGLLLATPLTLILVPSLYMIREDIVRLFKRKKQENSHEAY